MDWITDQIAIGDYHDAHNNAAQVDAILCLIENCCSERSDIDGCCVPLHDGPGNKKEHILAAIDFIATQVDNNLKVLVHCRAGRSRSVCIVAGYLMRHRGMSKVEALDTIGAKRIICLSDGIEEICRLIEGKKPSPLFCLLSTRIRRMLGRPDPEPRR
jgi:predicted protein tyrosine phosphatase